MLDGERADDLPGWLRQAKCFYQNLLDPQNADLLREISEFSYNADKLNAELAQVIAVGDADLEQEREKGEAQEATQKQDAKLTELRAWLAKHKPIAEVALADYPQWLEKLGLGAEE